MKMEIATILLLMVTSCFGLDVVCNLPGRLKYNKEHSLILTVFHADIDDRVAVSIVVRNQVNNRKVYQEQVAFRVTSSVSTHSIPIRANPSMTECSSNSASFSSDDVMCLHFIDVSVTTSSGQTWSHSKEVEVVKRRGHIFIETDLPVYRPGDEVNVRFIPVDETLRPLDTPMAMTILAPNPSFGGEPLLSWKKKKAASNAVFVRNFRLPDTPPIGQWKVKAHFYTDDIINEEFSTSFYVYEYKLPTFELMIRPTKEAFILPDDVEFSFYILANYVYGEMVEGTVNLRFGYWLPGAEDEMKTTHIISRSEIRGGRLHLTVPIVELIGTTTVPRLADAGAQLFIEASVTDANNGKTRSARYSDVMFTSSPLRLNFERTATYYKPGLPFAVEVSATFTNGSRARNISVVIAATAQTSDGMTINVYSGELPTCSDGRVLVRFVVPTNTNTMTVAARAQYSASTGRMFDVYVDKQLRPQFSSFGEYVQIVPPRNDFSVGSTAPVEIYVTLSPQPKTVVYTITADNNFFMEGKVEVVANSNQVMVTFPVLAEMSPTSHMTAYYVTQSPAGTPFIVADSSILRVEEVCRGVEPDTNIMVPGEQIPYPGEELNIALSGEPHSYVGLTSVDMAALSLRHELSDEGTIAAETTRSKTFELLRSFTPGCKRPTIPTPESSFPAIGRYLATSVSHNYMDASNPHCDEEDDRMRGKRSYYSSNIGLIDKADRFVGLAYECCAVGASDVTSVMSYEGNVCSQRAETVKMNKECKEAFLECCLEAECIRNNPTRTSRPCRELIPGVRTIAIAPISGGMAGFSIIDKSAPLLRSNFRHTWFAVDFQLGRDGQAMLNNGSHPRVPNLPDSITAWSIGTFTLSKMSGLCVTEPLVFAVEHSLFIEVNLLSTTVVRGTRVAVEVTIFNYLPTRVDARVILEAEENLCSGAEPGRDTEPIRHNIPESRGGVATSVVVRFTVIPLSPGDYSIKVKLLGDVGTSTQPRVDKVIKRLKVVPEGEPQRSIEWILVERKRTRGESPQPKQLALNLPPNTIPGSEKASITLHSITSAFLRDPETNEIDGSSTTIAQYLYKLESTIIKIDCAKSKPHDSYVIKLTSDAQRAYDGLLTYIRDVTPKATGSISSADVNYGFSFSPASGSDPDLWLSATTLRILCRSAILIEPDKKLLSGLLRWILSHQDGRGYFSNMSTPRSSRRKRSICSNLLKRRKKKRCNQRAGRYGSFRQFKKWQKKCRQKKRICRSRRRRSTDRLLHKLPQFTNNLDRKIYRTSVIASSLHTVLSLTEKWKRNQINPMMTSDTSSSDFPSTNLYQGRMIVKGYIVHVYPDGSCENRLSSINTSALRTSLRSAMRYIGRHVMRTRETFASPMSLTAAANSLFMLSGRPNPRLEETILRYREEENNTWWIKTNNDVDPRALTPVQLQQVTSANNEATSYILHLSTGRGLPTDNYATWLLKQRNANGRWVSLRDTLAAMEALSKYVRRMLQVPRPLEELSVQIATPGAMIPQVLTLQNDISHDSSSSNMVNLPVTNNAVSMTTVGSGEGWMEMDVQYSVPVMSSPATSSTADESLCPYDVTVNTRIAPMRTRFNQPLTRSSFTDQIWKIQLTVAYKPGHNPTEVEDQSYVVDFGLHSAYDVISEDLEKLSNSVEKAIDHYRLSQRALLLYMSGERNVSFRMKDEQTAIYAPSVPVVVYPAAFPERKCISHYSTLGGAHGLVALCSASTDSALSRDDVCICASSRNCPNFVTKSVSAKTITADRIELACNPGVKYAYRVKMLSKHVIDDSWFAFEAKVRTIYQSRPELSEVTRGQIHNFWIRTACVYDEIIVNKEYLIFGTSVVASNEGIFKFLLDSTSRVETWPAHIDNCGRLRNKKSRTICERIYDFDFEMRGRGCPT